MSDIRKTWSVIEVGPHLQTSTNPRNSFQVMRVTDHEDAVDAIVEKAAGAVKLWREKCEELEASLLAIHNAAKEYKTS